MVGYPRIWETALGKKMFRRGVRQKPKTQIASGVRAESLKIRRVLLLGTIKIPVFKPAITYFDLKTGKFCLIGKNFHKATVKPGVLFTPKLRSGEFTVSRDPPPASNPSPWPTFFTFRSGG
jgi:hypothetical protein